MKPKEIKIINMKTKNLFENFQISKSDIDIILKTLKEKDLSWPYGITKKFENKMAKFLKVKYALAHCNGTSAMYSAMFSVGIGPGTEVICPSYTWWASIAPAINLGATVVFCEINPDNLTIDPADVERKITKNTKAVIVPHLWGNLGNVERIKLIIKKLDRKVYIIEDASHAIGGQFKNKAIGTLGDVGIFSLQLGKPLPAGEGGLLVANNKKIYEQAILLGHYERVKNLRNKEILKYKKTGGGYKFRIHPLGAALAYSQLDVLSRKLKKQNFLMEYFEERLKKLPGVQLFNRNQSGFKIGGRFGFRVGINSNKLNNIADPAKKKMRIEREYVPLLHLEPFFTEKKSKYSGKGILPVTESLYNDIIGLPIFYDGTKKDIDLYVDSFLKNIKVKKCIK